MPTRCLNCNHEYDSKFCPECGQKAATSRLSWHSITHDLQHILLHLDKGVLKNIRSIWQPQLIRDFIAGKRVGYFNPIVLLLFVCGIVAWVEHEFKLEMSIKSIDNDNINHKTLYQVGYTAAVFFKVWSKYIEALLILPLGYFSWLMFRTRTGYNLIENIYTQAFILCNFNLIGLALYPFLRAYSPVLSLNFYSVLILIVLNYIVYTQIKDPITRILQVSSAIILAYLSYFTAFILFAYIYLKVKGA